MSVTQPILLPMLVLACWTMIVWLWMYATRLPAMGLALPSGPDRDRASRRLCRICVTRQLARNQLSDVVALVAQFSEDLAGMFAVCSGVGRWCQPLAAKARRRLDAADGAHPRVGGLIN